jgi:tyrosyl-tRNA synthetase
VHGDEAFEQAFDVTQKVFAKGDRSIVENISPAQFKDIAQVLGFTLPKSLIDSGLSLVQLLAGDDTKIHKSNSEARKAIQNNAISLNKEKVKLPERMITAEDLIHDQFLFLENGKKDKIVIIFE